MATPVSAAHRHVGRRTAWTGNPSCMRGSARTPADAGLADVLLRLGLWGLQRQHDPAVARAHLRMRGLGELTIALARYNAGR
jgi:hypothetical protein